jgi:hypothetical protein
MATGIFDGHIIEDRSVPLIKLESDVLTLADFNNIFTQLTNRIDALEANFNARLLILEAVHPDLTAHLTKTISTAHSGYINVATQIADSSIPTTKCAFTVLTLGTGHNQAAYGDHTHAEFSSFALAKPSGTGTLAGAGSYREINIGSVIPGFNIQLSIKRAAGSVDANIGDIWYTIVDNSRFRVYNTGSNNTDTFVWSVI